MSGIADDITNRYLHGPIVDMILADEQVTSTSTDGDVLWPLADNLGSIRDIIESDGDVINHIVYDAFGNITSEYDANVDHIFAFTGRERDEESDLQYNRFRYYDANVGRWTSEDPLGFVAGDANLSRYVSNAPSKHTDSSGIDEDDYGIVCDGCIQNARGAASDDSSAVSVDLPLGMGTLDLLTGTISPALVFPPITHTESDFWSTEYGSQFWNVIQMASLHLQQQAIAFLADAEVTNEVFRDQLEYIRDNLGELNINIVPSQTGGYQATPVKNGENITVHLFLFNLANVTGKDGNPYKGDAIDLPLTNHMGMPADLIKDLNPSFGGAIEANDKLLKDQGAEPPIVTAYNYQQMAALLANEMLHIYDSQTATYTYRVEHGHKTVNVRVSPGGESLWDFHSSLNQGPYTDPNSADHMMYAIYSGVVSDAAKQK